MEELRAKELKTQGELKQAIRYCTDKIKFHEIGRDHWEKIQKEITRELMNRIDNEEKPKIKCL